MGTRGDLLCLAAVTGMASAVAAAASVPSSFTSTNALWMTAEMYSASWGGSHTYLRTQTVPP